MNTKLEILKKLFIIENDSPKSLALIESYLSNKIRTVIRYSGITEKRLSGEKVFADDCWNDPDGDHILQRPFSRSLQPKEFETEIISINIDPSAKPKDVIRILNKITKEINDNFHDLAYEIKEDQLNQLNTAPPCDSIDEESDPIKIDKNSTYRDVMIALLAILEKYEEREWLNQKQIQEQHFLQCQKEDIRIARQLSKSNNNVVDFSRVLSRVKNPIIGGGDFPF